MNDFLDFFQLENRGLEVSLLRIEEKRVALVPQVSKKVLFVDHFFVLFQLPRKVLPNPQELFFGRIVEVQVLLHISLYFPKDLLSLKQSLGSLEVARRRRVIGPIQK